MSNEGTWKTVTFSELQAGDRVQVKIESTVAVGHWTRRTVDEGEFVLGQLLQNGWNVQDDPSQIAVIRSPHNSMIQSIQRYTPPFEFPTKLGTVFSGLHYEEGRHTFVVADRLSADDAAIYRNVTDSSWQDKGRLEAIYTDFKLSEA